MAKRSRGGDDRRQRRAAARARRDAEPEQASPSGGDASGVEPGAARTPSTGAAKTPTTRAAARPASKTVSPTQRVSGAARPARRAAPSQRRTDRRRSTLLKLAALAIGVLAVGVGVFFALDLGRPHLGVAQPFEGGVNVHLEAGAALPQRNRPPSSGPHYAGRAAYGVFTNEIAEGEWIHVLEHGGVVILYKCAAADECTRISEEIRTSVYERARPGAFGEVKITAVPYDDMDAPITAVSWGRVLPLDQLDPAQILAFYDRYLDRGPERAA